jgi:hypothetical protein
VRRGAGFKRQKLAEAGKEIRGQVQIFGVEDYLTNERFIFWEAATVTHHGAAHTEKEKR